MTLLVSTIVVAAAMAAYGMWAIRSDRRRALWIPARIEERRSRRDAEQRSR